ncbi:MAG: hypothetical protein KGK03_11200 [Candidatus Omnitrophica bacterium]|nr:hypothetical protein [Candidatus Omnitrophota bacterium]MDE2223624.1 hypothetical protein [Candidatus Omnitrophota bacterium]
MTELLVITCTYRKPRRLNYLNECVKTFRQVAFMRWIVVEDDHGIDPAVKGLLEASGITHVYLHIYSRSYGNAQKNLALTYIRDHDLKGIVYVADDDNVYDIRLFEEIRKTRKISVFPVGNLGPNGIERPILKGGKIVGWDADWRSRKYPVDQGGYAINAQLLHTLKDPIWDHQSYGGESEFIDKLIRSPEELEILCDDCRKCYMWHNYLLLPWPFRYPISKAKVMATKALRKMGVTFPGERI